MSVANIGYVYNGLHLRGPRKAQKAIANYVQNRGGQGRQHFQDHPHFQPGFDFQTSFDEIKQNFRPNSNNIEVLVEEVKPGVVEVTEGQFVTPTSNYVVETPTEAYHEPPATTPEYTAAPSANTEQYNFPPYVPPSGGHAHTKPSTETFYIGPAKPPVSISVRYGELKITYSTQNYGRLF